MGYNTSPKTCEKAGELLDHLLQAKATMEFETDEPRKLGYILREAIYAARYSATHSRFTRLSELYTFCVRGNVLIAHYSPNRKTRPRISSTRLVSQASRRERPVPAIEVARPTLVSHSEKPEESTDSTLPESPGLKIAREIAVAMETAHLPGVRNLTSILGMVLIYGRKNDEIYFPNAELSENDLERLFRWAEAYEWKIVWQEDRGLTLTKKQLPEGVAWRPNGH